MTRIAILILIVVTTVKTYAQSSLTETEKKGKNKFALSYGARLFPNNRDVVNDNIYPNTLSATDPFSFNHQVILDYQRTTKYGLIYGLGIEFGNRTYGLNVDFKTIELVDRPANVLYAGYTSNYKLKTPYLGIKPFIGYAYSLKKIGLSDWAVEVKAGILICLQTKGYASDGEPKPLAQYLTNDNKMINVFTETFVQLGKANEKYSGAVVGDLYLGLNRTINKGIVSDISLGLTFTSSVKYPSSKNQIITNYGMSTVITNYYYDGFRRPDKPRSVDYYTPREMSFGLRCTIGFWWTKH